MYSKLVFKEFEKDAHLTEHLFLDRFVSNVKKENIPIECVGFFGGEAFSDKVAFYGDFYTKRVAEIFEEVVNSNPQPTEEEILCAEKMIRAEENGEEKILKFRLTNLNLDEKKVGLRLFPIIHDLLLDFCRNNFAYLQDSTSLIDEGDDLVFRIKISVCEDFDLKDFRNKLIQELQNYHVEEKFYYIENIFKKTAECKQFYLLPLDFYRFTGIETSNEEIFELLSLQRVLKIFKSIKIEILN